MPTADARRDLAADLTDGPLYGVLWSHGACHAADTRTLTALCGRRVAYISTWSGKRCELGYGRTGPGWRGVTCSRCLRRKEYRLWARRDDAERAMEGRG